MGLSSFAAFFPVWTTSFQRSTVGIHIGVQEVLFSLAHARAVSRQVSKSALRELSSIDEQLKRSVMT